MSDRPCNHCTYERLKREAKKRGERAVLRSDPLGPGFDGVRVVYIAKDKSERDGGCWFMEVSPGCCC